MARNRCARYARENVRQSRHLHLAEAFAVLGLVFAVGVAQDRLLLGLRRLLCPYAELTTLGRTS